MIANKVRSAGLADILGATDLENVQGETQQKLDVLANEIIVKAVDHGGSCARWRPRKSRASSTSRRTSAAESTACSLIRWTARRTSTSTCPSERSSPSCGRSRAAAAAKWKTCSSPDGVRWRPGYVIYGSSTMLVYTTGQGAHGFTLDPSLGEFLLSHPNIRTPDVGRYLSVNDSYHSQWEPPVQNLMNYYRGQDGNRQPMNTRYVGSLVADFHRNLLGGGLFAYPANRKNKRGKLRLLYEGESSIVHRGAGRRGRHRWNPADSRRAAHRAPSTHAAFHREQE